MKTIALVVICIAVTVEVSGFTLPRGSFGASTKRPTNGGGCAAIFRPPTILFSSPQPKRVARRDLKKRRNKRQRKGRSQEVIAADDEYIETRPLVRSRSVEAGEDYWIDEEDLKKSLEREKAIKNRKAMEGEIPKEKLRTEVAAPYKQNWIGLISVVVIILATIIQQFPDLLQSPVIPIPDL